MYTKTKAYVLRNNGIYEKRAGWQVTVTTESGETFEAVLMKAAKAMRLLFRKRIMFGGQLNFLPEQTFLLIAEKQKNKQLKRSRAWDKQLWML